MCGLCGVLGVPHWADGVGSSTGAPNARQARARRARLLNEVLSFYHLQADDWQGTSMTIRGPTGQTDLAGTLPDLWRKGEAISRRKLDPLDPDLLAHLQRRAVTSGHDG